MRATFLHSKTGWLVACCSIQALYSLTASYSFLSRPFLVHHPLARSFVGPLLRRMHPFGESHLACANACISTGTAKSALAVSVLRFVSVLYFTRVGSQSPGRVAQHSTGIRGIGRVDLSLQAEPAILPASRLRHGAQKGSPARGPIKGPQRPSSSTRVSLCPPPSVVFLACIAAVSRYSQNRSAARCRNRWFVYIVHQRSLVSPPLPFPNRPHLRYFLQKEDSLPFPPRPSTPNPGQDLSSSPCSPSCCYPSEYPHIHPSSHGPPTPVGINCWIPWKHLLELKFHIPPASCEIFSTRLSPPCPCLLSFYPFPETWLNVLASGGSEWPHMPRAQARHITTRSSNIITISLDGL